VQASHACFEMSREFKPDPQAISHIILLSIKDEEHLIKTKQYLDMHNIKSTIFYEPDDNMGYTAIATEPLFNSKNLFKKYNLWKEGE
jgi:hypothetical protein